MVSTSRQSCCNRGEIAYQQSRLCWQSRLFQASWTLRSAALSQR
ncbi:hypothetical protein BIFGAL_04132 [Bifidobacterium gallicum DSM 20093 = LMG 11596]|uniref:Uncharacterized protein n=1 Tax=Bifidobacterium gallicum DSM 20093 = LMG 11596 TaxID=561180 RepID=D1NW85_9BIFI|nr:hypothetical protein BIFGAL_04132 [Bifidobacterium gallicum DSM 20093 = LMG 11596]